MSPKVTVEELTKHATADDCWVLVNGRVYDLTRFAPEHPGGAQVIHEHAGKDGTETYNMYHAASTIEKTLQPNEKQGDIDEATVTREWLRLQEKKAKKAHDSQEKPSLQTLINLHDFEQVFDKYGSPKGNAYIASASSDCLTLAANKASWQKLWFRPRIMRNVANVNTKSTMLGCEVRMPVIISPMGMAKVAGPQAEMALGAAAASSGIIHCYSSSASMPLDEVLTSVPPTYPYFFQLYVNKDRSKTEPTLRKIEGLEQIKAIFVTVDLPVVSKREKDERLQNEPSQSADFTLAYNGSKYSTANKKGAGVARATGSYIDPALCWDDIPWLRKHTSKPIIIKGVQSAEDALMAVKTGCQGILISNHGGRALDNAPATLLVLLELRRDCPEVFDQLEVYIDGGIRRGSDILKAICLGARGVGVGRPFQCAILYDKEGVESAASILQDELETAMRLCGVTDLNQVRGDLSYLNTSELQQLLPPQLPFGLKSRL